MASRGGRQEGEQTASKRPLFISFSGIGAPPKQYPTTSSSSLDSPIRAVIEASGGKVAGAAGSRTRLDRGTTTKGTTQTARDPSEKCNRLRSQNITRSPKVWCSPLAKPPPQNPPACKNEFWAVKQKRSSGRLMSFTTLKKARLTRQKRKYRIWLRKHGIKVHGGAYQVSARLLACQLNATGAVKLNVVFSSTRFLVFAGLVPQSSSACSRVDEESARSYISKCWAVPYVSAHISEFALIARPILSFLYSGYRGEGGYQLWMANVVNRCDGPRVAELEA